MVLLGGGRVWVEGWMARFSLLGFGGFVHCVFCCGCGFWGWFRVVFLRVL